MSNNTIKKILALFLLCATIATILFSCGSDDSTDYTEVPNEPVSPVVVDFNANPFPYAKLSEYKFFEGDLKNLKPAYKVIPYDLNSSLFTDYAEKKRFIWMPAGAKATYTADGKILDFPSGTVLIKNFYYSNTLPSNKELMIETRLLIKKNDEWIFANYVWNEDQTEAELNMNGGSVHMSFIHDGTTINTNYKIPAQAQCATCHKLNQKITPIGVKPQNLNKLYQYADGSKNQLQKLVEAGYLSGDNLPSDIVSTVDWTDESKPLELRVRSYLDINCAHCHSEGTHCDYTPMRLAFSESTTPAALGVCVVPVEFVSGSQTHIVAKKNVPRSLMHFRMNTNIQSEMMPQMGRTVIHTEAVKMIEDWINAMDTPCQ